MYIRDISSKPLQGRGVSGFQGLADSSVDAVKSFGDILKDIVRSVDEIQKNADEMARKLASGEVRDIHNVMMAIESANLTSRLVVQVRNKIVEAYQEIMRMQI
jgi:flagellar hook-basal body complex protein FliE